MHAYLFLIIQFFMHARSRKPYVYFRSIFVARAWFGIPPVLFLKNRQTGSYHRTSNQMCIVMAHSRSGSKVAITKEAAH